MTPNDIKEIVQETLATQEQFMLAREAQITERCVKSTLAVLGVDSDDPKDIRDFRETIAHSRKWKRNTEKLGFGAWLTVITVVGTGVLSATWLGMKQLIGR